MDAAFKRLTVMKKKGKDPALYDVVAIGTPIWATKMLSPVRIYLLRNKDRLKKVAFFLTDDETGDEKVLMGMAAVSGQPPVATLALTKEEVTTGQYSSKADKFVEQKNKSSASSNSLKSYVKSA